MKRPIKKVEKRGKQTLVINLVIAVLIIFVASIVLFDAFKSENVEQQVASADYEVKTGPKEIPRKETPKPKRKRQARSQDYKKYQPYFETKSGVDETEFDAEADWAKE